MERAEIARQGEELRAIRAATIAAAREQGAAALWASLVADAQARVQSRGRTQGQGAVASAADQALRIAILLDDDEDRPLARALLDAARNALEALVAVEEGEIEKETEHNAEGDGIAESELARARPDHARNLAALARIHEVGLRSRSTARRLYHEARLTDRDSQDVEQGAERLETARGRGGPALLIPAASAPERPQRSSSSAPEGEQQP